MARTSRAAAAAAAAAAASHGRGQALIDSWKAIPVKIQSQGN